MTIQYITSPSIIDVNHQDVKHEDNIESPPAYSAVFKNERKSKSASLKTVSPSELPILIPQTTATLMNAFLFPFARAYPEQLAEKGVDEQQFLLFLDGLNESFMASPIFRLLSTVGRIASFSPFPIVMGAGIGLTLASGLAGAAISYARTRAYVKKYNKAVFAPLGLQVRIMSTSKMMGLVYGSGSKKLILPPLPECHDVWDPSSSETDPRLRRMEALEGRVAPLRWDVMPADMPSNWLKKMGAWQAGRSDVKARQGHAKMCAKVNRKNEKATLKGNTLKAEKGKRKAESKEKRVNQRIRWIVIVPACNDDEEDVDLGIPDGA